MAIEPIFLAVAAVLWAAGFLLAGRFRSCPWKSGDRPARSVSVIIPARNEEHNLPKLLASLIDQSLQPHEIIVVDDASTDGTAMVARERGATVIAVRPLPKGWRGKTWACHQGAKIARGDLLLFVDADTWFESGGLARIVSHFTGGAFSVGPFHAVQRPCEDLSLFFNLAMTVGTVPDGLFGQMLLVDRESYQRVGGHEAVKDRILENFTLAERFRAVGINVSSVTGRGSISLRMYPGGFRELMDGWTKAFAAGAGQTRRATMGIVVAWMIGLMLAPIGLIAFSGSTLDIVLYLCCTAQVGWFARRVGAFRWITALVYPLPLIFFFLVFTRSALRSGRQVNWKGRVIRAD